MTWKAIIMAENRMSRVERLENHPTHAHSSPRSCGKLMAVVPIGLIFFRGVDTVNLLELQDIRPHPYSCKQS